MPDPGAQRADREVDVDVDIGVDPGQDDTVGEKDQGNGDLGNRGDFLANVQSSQESDTSRDPGFDPSAPVVDISYDFTPNEAVDKDEASLIAYDQYKGDPIHQTGDPSRSVVTSGAQSVKDQADREVDVEVDVVGAYVMAVASRTDQMGSAGTSRARANAVAARQNTLSKGWEQDEAYQGAAWAREKEEGLIAGDISMVGYKEAADRYAAADWDNPVVAAAVAKAQAGIDAEEVSLKAEQRDVRAELEARRNLATEAAQKEIEAQYGQLDQQVVGGRTMYSGPFESQLMADKAAAYRASSQRDAHIMAIEKSERSFFQERTRLSEEKARLSELEKQQKALANAQRTQVIEKHISTTVVANDQIKAIIAIDKLLENPQLTEKERATLKEEKENLIFEQSNQNMYDKLSELKDKIKAMSTFDTGFWKGFRKQDGKTKREVQEMLQAFYDTNKTELDKLGRKNSDLINALGLSGVNKGLLRVPVVGMAFGAIQGLLNSLGIAYHKTDSEKELLDLMVEWGLIEKEHNEIPLEERKTRCESKEGWEWDGNAQICKLKSADRFSEDKRFVPQY